MQNRELIGNNNLSRVQIKEGKKFWEKSLNELIEPGIKLEKEVTSEYGRQTKIIAKIRVMKLENPE